MAEAEYVIFADEDYYIRESRVTLASVVYPFRDGVSAETIRDEFSELRLDQVYGARRVLLGQSEGGRCLFTGEGPTASHVSRPAAVSDPRTF